MTPSLIVATILVAGWNLTLAGVALLTETQLFAPVPQRTREMSSSRRSVRAEVGKPEIDARSKVWKHDRDLRPTETVQSRIAESQREVLREVPYAEASVTVAGDEGDELRRCSVCMN